MCLPRSPAYKAMEADEIEAGNNQHQTNVLRILHRHRSDRRRIYRAIRGSEMAEAAAGCSGRRRFAAACGVLSRRVRAEAAERMAAAAQYSRSSAQQAAEAAELSASASTMLLMPGADIAPDVRAEEPAGQTTPAGEDTRAQAQLTIVYGGRVLVFDGVPADRAAELMRVAAQDAPGGGLAADMMPVARKASLQRFMEKRRDRLSARAPYATTARPASSPPASNKGQEEEVGDSSGCWLGLAISGGCARR